MSGYSDMLAQGKQFAKERKEKAKRKAVDSLAASLLGDLEQNIYQISTPESSSGV